MSSVAFAVSCASSLTSLATTAKPLPASPARAASIVAFSASRFVCSAMLVITLTTLPISAEDSPSLATVAVVVSAAVTARAATSLASAAFEAISRIDAPICSAPAATVCTLRDTSSAAPDTTPDCAEVSSADAEICADDADSSSDAGRHRVRGGGDLADRRGHGRRPQLFRATAIWPTSSRPRTGSRTARSPPASRSRPPRTPLDPADDAAGDDEGDEQAEQDGDDASRRRRSAG